MKKFLLLKIRLLFLLCTFANCTLFAQTLQWLEPITNQSSAILLKNKQEFLYTFFGMDISKHWKGVHKKVFKFDLQKQQSNFIGLVPDTLGRLASSASTIGNKAYIVGGYGVYSSGKEISSKQLFIFNPEDETFQKGMDLPIAIDDHVQAVWNNRYLYVISGWNDSNNVQAVQVYDANNNIWQQATPLPNDNTSAVFGGSGVIVGDTIYFLGGAQFAKWYPPSKQFYKGIIDTENPTHIKWIHSGIYPGEFRYRSVAFEKEGKIFFWGGSNETYNYNGISYAEKKPVNPNQTTLIYDIHSASFSIKNETNGLMDLRNVLRTSKDKYLIIGGMERGQRVSKEIRKINIEK